MSRKLHKPRRIARIEPASRAERLGAASPGPAAVVQVFSFEVDHEPVGHPECDVMSEQDRSRLQEIGSALIEGAAGDRSREFIANLEVLRARYPRIPVIWNFLGTAFDLSGDQASAERLIEETHREFPDYLFGIASYVRLCIRRGEMDAVEQLIGRKLFIGAMYPDRHRFHVSEVLAYTSVVIEYLFLNGEADKARPSLKIMEQLAPDHPETTRCRRLFQQPELSMIAGAISRLRKGSKRGGTRPTRLSQDEQRRV